MRVYYPTPQIVAHVPKQVAAVDTQSLHVQTEFTVAADGSVRDARIVDHDTRDSYARDILKAVRGSRFRPKFVDGQAVAATGITYREVFWTASRGTESAGVVGVQQVAQRLAVHKPMRMITNSAGRTGATPISAIRRPLSMSF